MRERLQKLVAGLGSAFPSAFSLYWRTLPMRRMKKLLTAAFFTFSVVGFVVDLLWLDHQRLGRGFFWPVFTGAMATGLLAARVKRIRLFPILFLIAVVVGSEAIRVSYGSTPAPFPAALKSRVLLDAIGILFGAGIGYRLLISFITTEGRENVRMETELSLAHGIQATLVPTVSFQTARFEVYGKSIPSTEMGGDLIDVIEGHGNLLAYVADISGHGLPAGQLMGMLKTAMRVSLQFQQEPVALLESADRVLPALKEPEMYATLALLYFDGSAEVEYALAGHVPILHYRDRTRDTARLSMEQFPLGLIAGGCYTSQRVTYSTRDLFLMLTDGISELPNEKDEEFGLTRLEQTVADATRRATPAADLGADHERGKTARRATGRPELVPAARPFIANIAEGRRVCRCMPAVSRATRTCGTPDFRSSSCVGIRRLCTNGRQLLPNRVTSELPSCPSLENNLGLGAIARTVDPVV